MVVIHNINKFVKSCGGRWLIEACPINAVLSLLFSNSECWVQVVKVMKEFSFNPLCFFFFLHQTDTVHVVFRQDWRMLWERRACKAGTTRSLGPREVWAELSFCPRRWAHAEGCSNSSDRHALETRSSVFWSLTGSGCTCKVRQRQARVRGPSTSETKLWPLSGQNDTLNHFKRDGLLLAEELPAVPAVVTPLGEGEANGAAGAAVHHLILHPVVGCRTTRLVADGPAEDSTTPVTHKDLTVVPVTRMNRGGNT